MKIIVSFRIKFTQSQKLNKNAPRCLSGSDSAFMFDNVLDFFSVTMEFITK